MNNIGTFGAILFLHRRHTMWMFSPGGVWRAWPVFGICISVMLGYVIKSGDPLRGRQDVKKRCISLLFQNIIYSLKWMQVVIIHDKEHDDVQLPSLKQQRYHVDLDYLHVRDILRTIYTLISPETNILIAASPPITVLLVREMDTFDFLANRTTDFRHNSKLVLIASDECFLQTIATSIRHLNNVVVIMTNCDKQEMSTLHNTRTGKIFVSVPYITKTAESSLETIFPNIKYGYNNRHLVVSSIESRPHVIIHKENGTVTYEGFAMDIWRIIARSLNLSYEVVEVPDHQWGSIVNGSWIGMVGQLVRREVDIVVADVSVTAERSEAIDFVYPAFKIDTVDIIYRRGPPSDDGLFQFLKPLNLFVYIALISACVVTLVLYIAIDNITMHVKSHELNVERERLHALWLVLKYCWDFTGSLLKQGFQRTPKTYSAKILLLFWWLFVLLITSAYSANLIAALSSPPREFTISRIDELTDSDYTVGMRGVGVNYADIKNSKRPNIRRLYKKMLSLSHDDSEIFVDDTHIHMTRVKQGHHAFLIYKSAATRYIANDCHLSLIGETVTWASDLLTFGLPKGSPLKLDLDRKMTYLKESGMIDSLWKKYTRGELANTTSVCDRDPSEKTMTMSVREFSGGFLVVCGGVALSFIALLVEICLRHAWNSR